HDVGSAAGREADDDLHRLGRIALREGRARQAQGQKRGDDSFHLRNSSWRKHSVPLESKSTPWEKTMARSWLRLLVLCSLSFAVHAQTFPSKPVHLVVPYPPGGITDILARTIAQRVSVLWGNETMIVDNRAGASGNIGVAYVSKAAPDGYTIVFGNASTHAINGALFKKLPFDPIKDFEPVTNVASVSNVLLVGPDFPGKTVADLIALAKAQPGKLTFASNSIGSSNHLSGELLKSMAKIDMLHVPYKGATAAQTDLIGGRITLMFDNMTTALPQIRAGKLRAL